MDVRGGKSFMESYDDHSKWTTMSAREVAVYSICGIDLFDEAQSIITTIIIIILTMIKIIISVIVELLQTDCVLGSSPKLFCVVQISWTPLPPHDSMASC